MRKVARHRADRQLVSVWVSNSVQRNADQLMTIVGKMDRRILLIEGDPATAETIRSALAEAHDPAFAVEWVRHLSESVEELNIGQADAVLLDLFLPDCRGLETFDRLWRAAPNVPILIICDPGDESLAIQAVERGAQDYLSKIHLDGDSLRHALRNMIERTVAAEAMFGERERAEVTLNSIGDAVLSTDLAGYVTYLNAAAERMTGWTRQDAAGRLLAEVFHIVDGDTREPVANPLALAVQENRTVGLTPNCVLIRRDGHEAAIEDSAAPIHDRRGRVTGAVIVFHDVSVTRAMSLQMSHLAHHDALTDLPNRLLLNDRLAQAIELGRRHRRPLAVLFMDLDRFKHINDSLGHVLGDQLLRSVAERLTLCVRSSDTVSRQGGDEFVLVLTEMDQASHATISAKKVLDAVAEPHHIAGRELHLTASIGVSVYPDDGRDAETLMKNADLAMYHAKEHGRGRYEFFQPDMNVGAVERQLLEEGLRRALDRQELVLHYQPKIDLERGVMVGAEALLRWHHPDRGLLQPTQFVPIAEDSGLIVPIGQWVLREACQQAQAWQDAGLRPIPVAVNVSAVEFRSTGFLEGVRRILEQTRLEPRYLELEVTESVLLAHGGSTMSLLRNLKTLGVGLALDDFGTGYSNLSYLKEFQLDALKVDESFVRGITEDVNGAAIVCAVITMGKSLNQRVIAEGIETAEQLAFLRAQHCHEGQGFYFNRPLTADEFAKLLAPAEFVAVR
jgi:diguanylate cyclase (GGDEF)-like protein/PAS domain S-box-containing protein